MGDPGNSDATQPSQGWPGDASPAGDSPAGDSPAGKGSPADIGHNETLVAETHEASYVQPPADLPRELGSVPVVTASRASREPPAPGRRRIWLASVIIAGIVLGAAIATTLVVVLDPDRADVGVDTRQLPPTTTSILVGRARSDRWGLHAVSEGELASFWAARACGGTDIARALELAAGGDLRRARSLGLGVLATPAELREPMACGLELARSVGQARLTEIAWQDGATSRSVLAVHLDKPGAPKGAPAGIVRGRTWFTGNDVDVFDRGGDARPGVLDELIEEASGGSIALFSTAPATLDLTLPCLVGAPPAAESAFVQHCFPGRFAGENESLAVKLRGVAIARDVPIDTGRVRLEVLLLAKDDAAAGIVETSLRAFWEELLAQVNAFEVELSKLAKQHPVRAVLFDPWLRALRNTTLSRDGVRLCLVAETALSDEELDQARKAAQAPAPLSADIDAIVLALGGGDELPLDALGQILGEDNAVWLVSRPATPAECAAIVAHAEKLPVDEERFGLRFAIQEAWAKDKCSRVLPASTQKCLLEAKDIQVMSRCAPPEHPDLRAARTLLAGNWIGDAITLHIEGNSATFVQDGKSATGGWELRSATDVSCEITLPLPGGGHGDFTIELAGERLLRMRTGGNVRVLHRAGSP